MGLHLGQSIDIDRITLLYDKVVRLNLVKRDHWYYLDGKSEIHLFKNSLKPS